VNAPSINFTVNQNLSYPASCGYNLGSSAVCPMFRGNNSIDSTLRNFFNEVLWKGDLTQNCSIATSLQYCANIEDNWAISLAYRSWMAWMWMTDDT